jgi:hypothetical protein
MSKGKRGTLSNREIRRMNQRENQRQQRQDAVQAYWNLPEEERRRRAENSRYIANMERNGITIEDVNRAANEGYQQGIAKATEATMKSCYAAMCLALHELHGFGSKRCMQMLNAVDEKVVYALTSEELVEQVFSDLEIEINFSEEMPGERVTEKGV